MTVQDRRTNLKAGAGLGLLFAGILGMMSWQKYEHISLLESPPERMTLQQFLDSDGGERKHVVLTDFLFSKGFAYMESSNQYSDVYIPIFPIDRPQPKEIEAVVESWDIRNEAEVRALQRQSEVDGICSAERSGFGVTIGPLLEDAEPGLKLEAAWRIRYFRERPTWRSFQISAGGSVICLLATGVCLLLLRRA